MCVYYGEVMEAKSRIVSENWSIVCVDELKLSWSFLGAICGQTPRQSCDSVQADSWPDDIQVILIATRLLGRKINESKDRKLSIKY